MNAEVETRIKASELRIGNFVECYGRLIKCIGLYSDRFYYEAVDPHKGFRSHTAFEMLQPIPLTSEILEACGFDNWVGETLSIEVGDDLYINWTNGAFEIGRSGNCQGGEERKMYLHQLQNLYFDLTGEELNVKF